MRCGLDAGRRVHLQQDHRHVVVLRRAADKGGDFPQDALAQFLDGQVAVLFDQFRELRLAEAVGVLVHRLADAVGEQHQQVARENAAG